MYKQRNFWLSILLFEILGLTSGLFALDARVYYTQLTLPFYAPPGWIFGPVWTILYGLMGIGHYLIWTRFSGSLRRNVLILFYGQFLLNFIWSFFFFTLKSNWIAMIDIVILVGILYVLQYIYYKHVRVLVWIFLPYCLWVSFATLLTLGILILN